MVMVCLTGFFSAALALLLPALPLAALGFSVADAGVPGLLEHPITKHSANSAATYNTRIAFTETPIDTYMPGEL
jgi:hypothetical protein